MDIVEQTNYSTPNAYGICNDWETEASKVVAINLKQSHYGTK